MPSKRVHFRGRETVEERKGSSLFDKAMAAKLAEEEGKDKKGRKGKGESRKVSVEVGSSKDSTQVLVPGDERGGENEKEESDEARRERLRSEAFRKDIEVWETIKGKPYGECTLEEQQVRIRVFMRRKDFLVAEKKLVVQAQRELRRRHESEYDEIMYGLRIALWGSGAPPPKKKKSPGKE